MSMKATIVSGPEVVTNRPFPNITPEQAEWLKRQPIPQVKRKMLHVEVSRRTFEAVKERPEKLKVIAEDGDGVAVFEKPAAAGGARTGRVKWGEPLSEAEVGTDEYNRLRAQPGRNRPPVDDQSQPAQRVPAGTPAAAVYGGDAVDQRWKQKRGWDGETRYVPDRRGGRGDEYVVSDYDIFAVLKE